MRLISTAILGISLLGCGEAIAFGGTQWMVVSDYCQSYKVIKPSRKDTEGTLQQVARENAKFYALCESQKK